MRAQFTIDDMLIAQIKARAESLGLTMRKAVECALTDWLRTSESGVTLRPVRHNAPAPHHSVPPVSSAGLPRSMRINEDGNYECLKCGEEVSPTRLKPDKSHMGCRVE